jgi:cytochrome c oxidase cbb3-type subunit 1
MWVTGVTQGLMWRAVTAQGDLMYSFIETVHQLHPYYILRAIGGGIYLVGVMMMGYNLMMTARQGRVTPTPIAPETAEPAEEKEAE